MAKRNTPLKTIASLLKAEDNILILTHSSPDGDTLGSGFALRAALKHIGKSAKVECADELPERYSYMFDGNENEQFDEKFIVSVDIADTKLLGRFEDVYGDKIDISIDHHPSNLRFARYNFVKGTAAATCEIIFELIKLLGAPIDYITATALYTGLSTDTGCFRYSNTTATTHRIAAALMEKDGIPEGCVDFAEINRLMFETKSRSRIEIERQSMKDMEFFCDNRCAMICITQEMLTSSGVADDELEGITSLPRKIEGVILGITLKEREPGDFRVSMRSHEPIDASQICGEFGGGGHARAAGCRIKGDRDTVKALIRQKASEYIEKHCKT